MRTAANLTVELKRIAGALVMAAGFSMMIPVAAGAQAAAALPEVHLDADGLAPRPIEELTGTTVARGYSLAWRDLAAALESGRADGVNEEFAGVARDRLRQRMLEQTELGLHVRIVDHGHHLKAVFYSMDGTALQLLDQAQLEIQTFDGNKLLDTESGPHEYVVLMTPGADRWYVRNLEEVSPKTF